MKLSFLCVLCFVSSVAAADPAPSIPALAGKPPEQADGPMQWGEEKHGIKIGLSKPNPVYTLNHRINIWIAYHQAGTWEEGYKLGADTLLLTKPDGSVTTMVGDARIDFITPREMGMWTGGMSDKLHRLIRQPGMYKMQWKLGDLESGAISFTVVR